MKNVVFLLFTSLMLLGCGQSKEEKAASFAENEVKKILNDASSYEAVETKVDSAFTSIYIDYEACEAARELSEMYFQKKSLQEDYNNEKSSIANWSGIQSTYAQEQIKQAQEKLSEIKKKQNRLDDKIIKNQNIIKEKYKTTDEGEFCGWAIYHRFRYGKNKFLADILIITDKNIENLENSIMIEDYNPLMELIGDKLKEFGFNNNDLNFEQIKQIIDDVLEK